LCIGGSGSSRGPGGWSPLSNGTGISNGRPAGVPISRALEIRPGVINDDLREAILAINQVHGDGSLPSIPVSLVSLLATDSGQQVDGLLRVEEAFDGQLVAQSIRIRAAAPHRSFVLLHEVGHVLDVHGLPGPTFASADERVTMLTEWRRAIGRSRAVQVLREFAFSNQAQIQNRANRLLEAEELWARSYVQFVAIRCRHEQVLSSLNAQRYREQDALYFPRQWDDDDFAEIDVAIEELFRRLGWIA
jgi:hypothetical protein